MTGTGGDDPAAGEPYGPGAQSRAPGGERPAPGGEPAVRGDERPGSGGESYAPGGEPYGLGALGVPAGEEALYRAVLARPGATVAELAAATGWDPARVRRRIRALELRGLVARAPGGRPARFGPAPPEVALEALALRRRAEIERARLVAAGLADGFRSGAGSAGARRAVEPLVCGPEAAARFALRLQETARVEVLTLGEPPVPPREPARGVRRRAIYDHGWLDSPERLAAAGEAAARLGERSRVLAEAPLTLLAVDRAAALVRDGETALVLRSSALLDGLLSLWELLWQRALPLYPGGPAEGRGGGLSDDDERLLALSASGLTDRAIARRLGVAQRTVERRMRRIMNTLGARTRFQAGLRVAELAREPGRRQRGGG